MTESDEIQRHVKASAAELRAAAEKMANLKSELTSAFMDEMTALKSDIQEINQQLLRMEAQLQEFISRAGAT
jgi:predicted  nucleic acid-binding Zn-ribbon protein